MKTQLLFDLESTGLLRRGSQIHCIVMRDMSNPEEPMMFDPDPERADVLIGHNIIGFDVPLIKEQYDFNFKGDLIDTLVLSRIFYPNIGERDYMRKPSGMPQKLYGRHSLEAWGYRLKCFKGDFGKQGGAWETYTPEMLSYCVTDTEVTLRLFELMQRRMQDYD